MADQKWKIVYFWKYFLVMESINSMSVRDQTRKEALITKVIRLVIQIISNATNCYNIKYN